MVQVLIARAFELEARLRIGEGFVLALKPWIAFLPGALSNAPEEVLESFAEPSEDILMNLRIDTWISAMLLFNYEECCLRVVGPGYSLLFGWVDSKLVGGLHELEANRH